MHIITIAFTCSQIKWCQLHLTSSVNMLLSFLSVDRFFAEISKQMCILCYSWSLGSEETESDPVCLCDSGAKIIPLWNVRVRKVEKLSKAPLRQIKCIKANMYFIVVIITNTLPTYCFLFWFQTLQISTFEKTRLAQMASLLMPISVEGYYCYISFYSNRFTHNVWHFSLLLFFLSHTMRDHMAGAVCFSAHLRRWGASLLANKHWPQIFSAALCPVVSLKKM